MLRHTIAELAQTHGAESVAVAYYDYETQTAWSYHGDQWFHAASTIKVALLAGVFAAIDDGRFALDAPVHVRNRFFSIADGSVYRIASRRDANAVVHKAIGQTMPVDELAYHMIVTSSNLATNLLLDLIGVANVQATVQRMGLRGIDLQRGVEDNKAFDANISNRVTANGLVQLFQHIHEAHTFSPEASQKMLNILFAQQFKRGLPAGLPLAVRKKARCAHKTGEISTIAHDAGLVFLPNRQPYAVALLTQWDASQIKGRRATLAALSETIYRHLTDTR